MAGFEVVVRPMILPNIRPAVPRLLPFVDDPEQGKCVISGQSAGTITFSYTNNVSIQRASAEEEKRMFDVVRIRQLEGGQTGGTMSRGIARASRGIARAGSGDDGAYIDVEVVNKLWLKGTDGKKFTRNYAEIEPEGNMTILRRNVTR